MNIGFHISIAGGFRKIVARAQACKCTTIQLFTRNPRGWAYKPLDKDDVRQFKKDISDANISPVFVHAPYLINCASADRTLYERSLKSLIIDLERAHEIGARYVIVHAGSSGDVKEGITRMTNCINTALCAAPKSIIVLIENTAGSGNEIGYSMAHLASIIDRVKYPHRIGIVFDTAHAAAAGYNLITRSGVRTTFTEVDKLLGIARVYLIHLNDLKMHVGSRRDRHWHIGKGSIGKGMRHIITHPLLKNKPFIMETPRKSIKDDLRNLRTVLRYAGDS
jgi:deoxyribonuclease-4